MDSHVSLCVPKPHKAYSWSIVKVKKFFSSKAISRLRFAGDNNLKENYGSYVLQLYHT